MYTEAFPSGPMRHYFFDYKQGARGDLFVQLTCSEKQRDGGYQRNRVVFFERISLWSCRHWHRCHHAAHLKLLGPEQVTELKREKGIPSWEPETKPRERLLAHGPLALSDAELLAMLIGSGTTKETAVDLAARVLEAFGGLAGLMGASYKRLSWSCYL